MTLLSLCNIFDVSVSNNFPGLFMILFETWVEKVLIKELNPGQVVIMDNASFHKSQKTKELIESVGCNLIFLPPYSPDLNPIEKFWANMKRWIKNRITEFDELYEALFCFLSEPCAK